MRRIILVVLICLGLPILLVAQEKAKSNTFTMPGVQKQPKPAELKLELSFKEPSGNARLDAEETGQLTIVVKNTGEAAAKDVRIKLSISGKLEGVTFPKDLTVGTLNTSEEKTVTASFVAAKTVASQKCTVSVEAIDAATQKIFQASIPIETIPSPEPSTQSTVPATQSRISQFATAQPALSEKQLADLRFLRNRIAQNPNDGASRLQLITVLFGYRMWNDVVVEGERAIVSYPDRVSLFHQIGESYRQLRKYDQAFKSLSRGYSASNAPYSDLAASYALTLLRLGRVQEATPILRRAAQADPTFINKRLVTGNEEYKENDFDHAADELYAVMILDRSKLTPDQTMFVQFSVDFKNFMESKDPAAATAMFLENLKRRLGEKFDYDELGAAFTCMATTKQLDQARSYYSETMKLKPETVTQDSLDRLFLDAAYDLSGNCPDILNKVRIAFIRTMKSIYDLNEDEAKPIYALHEFVLRQGLVSAASEITSGLTNGTFQRSDRYARLVETFLRYKKTDEAVGTFSLMLKKKGLDKYGYSQDLVQMYAGLLKSQRSAEAQDLMKQVSMLDESDINGTYARLADIFTKSGDAEKSIVILQKLLQNDPTNVSFSVKLGDAFLAKGRYDDVIASFANVKTKEGKRYLAQGYEKKYMLSEANRTWEEYRKMTNDPNEIAEAKKHIDDNLITMMNPDFAKLQAEANKPKSSTATTSEKLRIVIDSPSDGFQTSANSVEVTGRILGALTLQDVKINGKSVGTPRGMKAAEATGQPTNVQDASKTGLPFAYLVTLAEGKNDVMLRAFTPTGDSAEAKISVTMGAVASKAMTIEEADGIRQTKAYAVIIGVANYKSDGIKSLKYTVNDAKELYNVLTDPTYGGFKKENVTLLVDKDATTANIKKAIGADLKRAPEDGIAIVFFAGHGAPEGEQTYWMTYDTDPASLYASTLSNDDIVGMLNRISTKRVVTFIDACYSGASVTTARSTRAFVEDPFKAFEGAGKMTITSSDGREQSLEDEKLKHGIFTYRLLEAIKGRADHNSDGIVMADEIARYIKETVPNDARERSHKQDPVVVSAYSGYIPISRNPENVLKNSRIIQIQHFTGLYREGQIDAVSLKKIKDIIEGNDEKSKQPIKDYFNKVFSLKDLLDIIGR